VVFLVVKDVDELHEELKAKGIAIDLEPTDQSWGTAKCTSAIRTGTVFGLFTVVTDRVRTTRLPRHAATSEYDHRAGLVSQFEYICLASMISDLSFANDSHWLPEDEPFPCRDGR
jgi:hypothetical protein